MKKSLYSLELDMEVQYYIEDLLYIHIGKIDAVLVTCEKANQTLKTSIDLSKQGKLHNYVNKIAVMTIEPWGGTCQTLIILITIS